MGRDGPAARVALRGRGRPVRARARGGRRRAAPTSSTGGSPRPSEGWTADRLGALERNVLRIAIYELDDGDVPLEVAIDEAVALAKRYASEDAAKLVNGILGRIAREAAA